MADREPNAASVIAAQLAQSLEQIVRIVSELLSESAVIDQAVGVLMSRSGTTADEALDTLDRMSRNNALTRREVAQLLVNSAGRDRQ